MKNIHNVVAAAGSTHTIFFSNLREQLKNEYATLELNMKNMHILGGELIKYMPPRSKNFMFLMIYAAMIGFSRFCQCKPDSM